MHRDAVGPDPPILGRQFVSFLYHEVRAIARRQLARERPNHTLSATALVHELYLRLERSGRSFASDEEFVPAAAHMIREILVDYARARKRWKRGRGNTPVDLNDIYVDLSPGERVDIESLHEAIEKLSEIGERQAQVVQLRFFGGLSVEESAAVLHISPKTVKRDWVMARSWLRSRLSGEISR